MWLIDNLSNGPLTLAEIQKKWEDSQINEDGTLLTSRTFTRYRREIESLMKVDICCDKSQGSIYYINKETDRHENVQEWMLSAFRMSQLSDRVNQRKSILLDEAPPASNRLQDIMEAIDKQIPLRLSYKSHYKDVPSEMTFYPSFVRLFRQRWYVIGEYIEKKIPKTLALERIKQMELIKADTFKFSQKNTKLLSDPERYFEDCFGVIRMEEPIFITFRAFWPQDAYLKDTPIHYSQKVVNETTDYSDFEVYVRPTYDLTQEFLWNRDKVTILSPSSFKDKMVEILENTLKSYKTGNCYAEE